MSTSEKKRSKPSLPFSNDIQKTLHRNLEFTATEQYKLIRTNLDFTLPEGEKCPVIGVTSAMRGEGKSTTAINLSYVLAERGSRVLLIDGDLRIPSIAKKMDISSTPGLTDVLMNKGVQQLNDFKTSVLGNWFIMPSGEIPPNPSELLGSKRMEAALKSLREHFDYIIITPYIERDTLPEEDRLIIEGVYKQIVESPDLSALTEDLIDVAAKLGVEVKDLAVSDLFDVRYIGCDIHQYHGIFRIKIKAETLDNFVCLLHFHEGEYHIVEDAKVTEDGDYLVFTTNKLSPFAIVVNTSEENPDAPQTNDLFPIYVSIAAVSGLMLIGLAITYKKERA